VANTTEAMWSLEFFDGPLSLDGTDEEIVAEIYERGYVVEANDAFAQSYGYGNVEEMGTWKLKERLENNSQTMEAIRSFVSTNFAQRDLETVELDRDGNTRIFLNNLDGQIEDGRLLRIWGTARDVTESRQQESELDGLKRLLARAARLGTMGELSAAIAHEISQPLTAIATNARAAQRFLADPDPNLDEVSEILEDIIVDDRRAAAVSQNIRALVAARETPRENLDVGELVLSVLQILRTDAIFRNIEISLNLDQRTPRVWCDGVQIQQVVINLLLNGCEAMVESPPEDRRLAVELARDGTDIVRVSVRDSGGGFEGTPPEGLFQPFETSKEQGLGMGLSISRSIVESHGGKIWGVENPEGGATFHFTLPTAPQSSGIGGAHKRDS
jgi:PAS domain S-box-containing protein